MALFAQRLGRLEKRNEFNITDHMAKAEAMGRDLVRLNLGEPDFDSAENINECAMAEIKRGNTHYCDPQGVMPFREAVAGFVSRTRGVEVGPDMVVATAGGKPPIPFSMLTYVDPGDEVIYPSPGFPAYEIWARYAGAVLKPLHLNEAKDFRFDAADLEPLVTRKTKLLVLNSPSNPTGGVLSRDDLKDVARIMLDKAHPDFRILSDEVYEKIIFDGRKHESIMGLPGMREHTVLMNCHSKTYAMTGWRVGYAVLPTVEEARMFRLWSISVYSCTQPFIQMAARQAIIDPVNDEIIKMMRDQFEMRRNRIIPELNRIPGIRCINPGGAFYALPNVEGACQTIGATEFCRNNKQAPAPATMFQLFALYNHGVATLDRASFGRVGIEGLEYVRISMASSLEQLKAGVERMAAAAEDKKGFAEFIAKPDLWME